ncbi:hypothetical protein NECAME_12623 [Necator americanus]|uniref:Uncharacterized protein n=1 Tax=Necator americanus TaxID=51031 RepID=W2T113_NECAM|nr:hypothetical protein NECAME_12623 [Necator americanus]ETN74926.1 hypothetical protein NECAME_12623 [Necator americanus]
MAMSSLWGTLRAVTGSSERPFKNNLCIMKQSTIMGKGRNKNKDKDTYSGARHKGRAEDSDSDDSVSTHFTVDDDMRSVQVQKKSWLRNEQMNKLKYKHSSQITSDDGTDVDSPSFLDSLGEHIENAGHKKYQLTEFYCLGTVS